MNRHIQLIAASSLMLATFATSAMAEQPAADAVAAAKIQLKEGNLAKDFRLTAVAGELSGDVELSEVNADGRVVIVVLRGYPGSQCPACTAQVADLVKHADEFTAKGIHVLLVYPGAKSQLGQRADEFLHGTELPSTELPKPLTFLLDPGFQFTNAYGLRWDAPNETAYPTTIVVDKDGKISFVNISDSHRGRVKAEDVLSAL